MGWLSWIAVIALFFYLTPFARLVTRPLRALLYPKENAPNFPYHPFLFKLGRLEYLLGPFRDRLLSITLLAWVFYLWWSESPLSKDTLIGSSLIVSYNLLAILAIRYRDYVRMKLFELARVHSNIHPEDFFNLYYNLLSPWPPPFPTAGYRSVEYFEADYRSGKLPTRNWWSIVEASVSTSTLARMAIMAFKRIGPDYGRDAFDGLARLWGSRVAQICKIRLSTVGWEQIPPLEGKTLLLFNHQSYLDFAFNFFALGKLRSKDGRHLRPRFIAAKDHFIDNPFVYSWVSLGKVIENAGMIFINRKKGRGWAAMEEAAEKLMATEVEIAVYPQGTRAHLLKSPSGERLDAGFYTTFKKSAWDKPLGHLKPGTGFLILNTLIQLKKRGKKKLNIVVSGITGAGRAGPKGSFMLQTETEIQFKLAPLWELPTSMADGISPPQGKEAQTPEEQRFMEKIETVRAGINEKLLQALGWHSYLRDRLKEDLEFLKFSPNESQDIMALLDQADASGNHGPYILVERIISLDLSLWDRFFRLLLTVKDKSTGNEAWRALLQEVSERVLRR